MVVRTAPDFFLARDKQEDPLQHRGEGNSLSNLPFSMATFSSVLAEVHIFAVMKSSALVKMTLLRLTAPE
jgi:hypothetical protein